MSPEMRTLTRPADTSFVTERRLPAVSWDPVRGGRRAWGRAVAGREREAFEDERADRDEQRPRECLIGVVVEEAVDDDVAEARTRDQRGDRGRRPDLHQGQPYAGRITARQRSSTTRNTCHAVMPMPRAASTVSLSTSRIPTYALVMIGGRANSTRAIRVASPGAAVRAELAGADRAEGEDQQGRDTPGPRGRRWRC